MRPRETTRHEIAGVPVAVRDRPTRGLLIELLEVGRRPQSDRLLGSTTGISDACRMLTTDPTTSGIVSAPTVPTLRGERW
jgi:hypothetical protein